MAWGERSHSRLTRQYRKFGVHSSKREKTMDTRRSRENYAARLLHDYAQNKKKWGGFAKPSEIAHAFQQEIEQAPSEDEKTSLREKRTARKTWNRHLSMLSEFWKWGKLNALTFPTAPNPFEQFFLIVDDEPVSEGGSEERKPWREEAMRALFASPLFTGCRSPGRRYVPGNLVIRDALYWVVLIVAYTGMRREEICQLRVEHLFRHEEKDIWYFNLKAPGLQLKTMKRRGKKNGRRDSGSKRWVTVPDALIQLGIIEALHKGREPNEQLFPDLYRSKSNNSFGDKLSQKFGTYRKNYDEAHRKSSDAGHAFVPLYAHL